MDAQFYADWWKQMFEWSPHLDLIAPQDSMGANGNSFSNVSEYLSELAQASRAAGRDVWSNVELCECRNGRLGPLTVATTLTPPFLRTVEVWPRNCTGTWEHCQGRHPAPMERIIKQMANEYDKVSLLIAWEWHSCLSPHSTDLSYGAVIKQRYEEYKAYITQGALSEPPSLRAPVPGHVHIVGNRVEPGGQSVATVAQLQALLDANPNTVFDVRRSRWEIDREDPKSIWLHSNRTLMMDSETVIVGTAPMPLTNKAHEGGGALLTVTGNNISLIGGRFEQEILPACAQIKTQPTPGACNFAIDIYFSSGVLFRDTVVQGSFMSAVRVQEGFWPPAGNPPISSHWSTLSGLARQPVFITNVTLLHHANESLFQLRGFWTVMTQNVIFSRNTILGPFMYSIDLDSSSSANIVHNNYMEGPVWEGIFTEYSAVGNVITGNTVVGNVANQAHIHVNGALNVVVDNTARINETLPGGIVISSSLSMYNSYALSNRVVGNSAGVVTIQGDGGCDNYVSANAVDVAVAGSKPAAFNLWQKPVPNVSQDCIAGVDSTLPAVTPPPPPLPPPPQRHERAVHAADTGLRGL